MDYNWIICGETNFNCRIFFLSLICFLHCSEAIKLFCGLLDGQWETLEINLTVLSSFLFMKTQACFIACQISTSLLPLLLGILLWCLLTLVSFSYHFVSPLLRMSSGTQKPYIFKYVVIKIFWKCVAGVSHWSLFLGSLWHFSECFLQISTES